MSQFGVLIKPVSCYRTSLPARRKQLLSHFTLLLFPILPDKTILQLQRCLPLWVASRSDLRHCHQRSCKIRSVKKEAKKKNSMETTKNSEHCAAASLINYFQSSYHFGPQYLSLSDLITTV